MIYDGLWINISEKSKPELLLFLKPILLKNPFSPPAHTHFLSESGALSGNALVGPQARYTLLGGTRQRLARICCRKAGRPGPCHYCFPHPRAATEGICFRPLISLVSY